MAKLIFSAINFCTAQLLRDTESPREIEATTSRRLCRILVAAMVIISFTAVVTLSLLNQPPKRSQRVWITKKDSINVTRFLDRMALQLNSGEWQCPCKAEDVVAVPESGTIHLVDFFLIDKQRPDITYHVDSMEQFCSQVSSSQYFQGFNGTCQELLKESFRSSGWNFMTGNSNLYMNSLRTGSLNPIAFMFEVCMSWAGGLSQATSYFLLSNFSLEKEKAQMLNTFLRSIKTSLETCAKHANWPPPDGSLYLEEAKLAGVEASEFRYVVAIRFDWNNYFNICAPSYCENVELNSCTWMLFTALAQVGGFVSVALFSLRSVIWPLFCMIFDWPSRLVIAESKGSYESQV